MMIKNFNYPTSPRCRQLLVDVNDARMLHEYSSLTNKCSIDASANKHIHFYLIVYWREWETVLLWVYNEVHIMRHGYVVAAVVVLRSQLLPHTNMMPKLKSDMRIEVERVHGPFWHIRHCFLEVEEEESSKHYLSNDARLHRPMNIGSIVTKSA